MTIQVVDFSQFRADSIGTIAPALLRQYGLGELLECSSVFKINTTGKSKYSFIGTAALDEKLRNDPHFRAKVAALYDAEVVSKNSLVTKPLGNRKVGAQDKTELLYHWVADYCLSKIRGLKKLKTPRPRENKPTDCHVDIIAGTPQHELSAKSKIVISKTKMLKLIEVAIGTVTQNWKFEAPESSLKKLSTLQARAVIIARELIKECSPIDQVRVGGESPTSSEVDAAVDAIKGVSRAMLNVSTALPQMVERSLHAIQKKHIRKWKTTFQCQAQGESFVHGRLTRWGIGDDALDAVIVESSKVLCPEPELRMKLGNIFSRVCAKKTKDHFARRAQDRALPASWQSMTLEDKSTYLKAEHGWRFVALSSAWSKMAQVADFSSISQDEKLMFIHECANNLCEVTGKDIVESVFAVKQSIDPIIHDPTYRSLRVAWEKSVTSNNSLSRDPEQFLPFSKLLSSALQAEERDLLPRRYQRRDAITDLDAFGGFNEREFAEVNRLVEASMPEFWCKEMKELERDGRRIEKLLEQAVFAFSTLITAPPKQKVTPFFPSRNDGPVGFGGEQQSEVTYPVSQSRLGALLGSTRRVMSYMTSLLFGSGS